MEQCKLSSEEILRRKNLSNNTRQMICGSLKIKDQEDNWVMASYKDFDLRIIFSEVHPLMVLCLEKPIKGHVRASSSKTNLLNLTSVLGSHCINVYSGLYQYRAAHWLDAEITHPRFLEILNRCVIEASRGYQKIAS